MTTLPTTWLLLAQVGSGRLQGGWGYVWACYSITTVALVLYSLSLWVRRPKASHDTKE